MPVVALVVASLVLTLLSAVAPQAAMAAPPVPVTPHFAKAIEGWSGYQPQQFCDPVDKPGTVALAQLIKNTYGSDQQIGISRNDCYTVSEHNDGRALDWTNDASNPADVARVNAFLGWLLGKDEYGHKNAMARRLGVMYIIWNHKIWRPYSPRGWGDYTGSDPHTTHIHISLNLDGAAGRTSFWTGTPLAGACTTTGYTQPAPSVVTAPMNFVPVQATRVLVTHSGHGTANGPCRLFAAQDYYWGPSTVDAQVTGVGAVPATGVAAVALQVTMSRPNWASNLMAGPAGSPIPSVTRASAGMNASTTASMVLPVGADGKVSFASSFGATDLVVSVVGYYLDPNAPDSVTRLVSSGGDQFHPASDARLLSSQAAGPLAAGATKKLAVAGTDGVDPSATAGVVSVTVGAGKGRGSVYVYPSGTNRPKQALVEYGRQAQTVQATVPLGDNGAIVVENGGRSSRDVDVDLVGSYEPQSVTGGLGFGPRRNPATVVATRKDLGLRRIDGGTAKSFSVARVTPKGTRAVLLQVSVRKASADTELTFWRADRAQPSTVDLSAGPRRTVSGLVVVPVSPRGRVGVYASAGNDLDVKVTVVGSFR